MGEAVPRRHRRLAVTQTRIERISPSHLLPGGLDPHRLVPDHTTAFQNRRDIRADPVIVAVFAAVLDHPHPAFTGFEVAPHQFENRGWHVGVANQIVRTADQLILSKTAHGGEFGIAVSDMAVDIRG
jgi:hypothetical protein